MSDDGGLAQPVTGYDGDKGRCNRIEIEECWSERCSQLKDEEQMNTRLSRSTRAFVSYLLVFLITYSLCGVVIELIWLPFIAWMHDYDGYLWPSKSRIYAWCKLIPFATIVSGVGVWLYERKRIGW